MSIALAAPFVLAGVFQGQPFSSSVGVIAAGGDTNLTLILQNFSGTIPPGLSVTLGSGGTVLTVAGTPTTLGDYAFGFQIHNTAAPNTTIFVTLFASVTVVPSTPVPQTPNPMNLPGGTIISRFNIIVPAFVYNGALWQFTTEQDTTQISGDADISGHIAVYKGALTGNGSPWTAQDYANNPLYSWDGLGPVWSMDACQGKLNPNELAAAFMGSTGFPTPDTPTSVYIKIFDAATGLWRTTSSAGPAVNYSTSPITSELRDLEITALPDGTYFIRYERFTTSGSTWVVQYSIYDPVGDTWPSLDVTYDSGSGGFGGSISLLSQTNGLVTDLYVEGALAWWNKNGGTTHGPSLVPSGSVPSQQGEDRVQGAYLPDIDTIVFPLSYSNTWVLAGTPSANPTWAFTEIDTGNNAFSAIILGPDGKAAAYVYFAASGGHKIIKISIFTGGKWQTPIQAADLFTLFGITSVQDTLRLTLLGNDIGVTFGGNQTVGMTTFDSVAYFLRIPLVFPESGPPPPSPPSLACPIVNKGVVGVPYSSQLIAAGGTPPYTFSVVP